MNPEIKQRIEQIRRGEVPEGYKKAKQCICPADWETTSLRELADIGQGYTFKREYQGNHIGRWNYFKVADIGLQSSSIYLSSSINKIDDFLLKQLGYKPFHAGSIVFPRVGAALLNNNKKILLHDSLVDDNVLVLSIKNKAVCSNIFLYYLLSKFQLADWCNSGLVPVINSKTVLKQSIHLPEFTEQQKISAILSTQDKAIGLKEKRLAEKQRQKKYLMQQLLTGKKRLSDFTVPWVATSLGNLFSERKETNCEKLQLLAITGTQGVIPRSELDLKDNSSEDKSKYLKIRIGDIGYNTMRMWQGVSAYSDYEGIVSPAYTILKPVADIDAKYFSYLFKLPETVFLFYRFSQGLVDDTRNLKYENFKKITVRYPSDRREQTAIAKVLSTADREIDLLRQDIDQEKQKKKALMQLLLTGIVRVTPCH